MGMNRETENIGKVTDAVRGYVRNYERDLNNSGSDLRSHIVNNKKKKETIKELVDAVYTIEKGKLIFDIHGSRAKIIKDGNNYLLTEPAHGGGCSGFNSYFIGYCIWFLDSTNTKMIADFQGNKEEAEEYFKFLESKREE